MLVYVESNFLLELVLNQEEGAAANELLARAQQGSLQLAIPIYALVEPAETLRRRQAEMREFSERIRSQLRELERMAHASIDPGTHTELAKKVFDALNDWPDRLDSHRQAIVRVARLLPLEWPTLERARELMQQGLIKREPDALMLAAVVLDAEALRVPSLFLNRNRRDFNQELSPLLSPLGCEPIGSFRDGLARLDALRAPGSTF